MNTILDIRINSRFISPEMIYCFSFVVKRMFCYYVVKFKNKDILNLSKDTCRFSRYVEIKKDLFFKKSFLCRGSRIRTCDPLLPKHIIITTIFIFRHLNISVLTVIYFERIIMRLTYQLKHPLQPRRLNIKLSNFGLLLPLQR